MTLPIAIAGAAGRMGCALVRAASARSDVRVFGATERAGADALGQDVGVVAGVKAVGAALTHDPRIAASDAAVWIDFTAPAATTSALDALTVTKVHAAVIGTTGLSPAEEAQIEQASKRFAIVRSNNFSLGVNLVAALVRQAAERLGPDWDIEIIEAHHRRKQDAPSGTALMLAEAAAQGRGKKLDALRLKPRDGQTGPRPEGGIGFAVVRGGGIVGQHDVSFAAEREIVTLSHEALDRAVFADGALAAAVWAAGKPPGLYSMADVLGL